MSPVILSLVQPFSSPPASSNTASSSMFSSSVAVSIVSPSLLFPISIFAFVFLLISYRNHRLRLWSAAVFAAFVVLPIVAGSLGISAVVEPNNALRHAADLTVIGMECKLSLVTLYILAHRVPPGLLSRPFLLGLLSVLVLIVACETITALVPSSSALHAPILAILSHLSAFLLAMVTFVCALRPEKDNHTDTSPQILEKSTPSSGRVSSPTTDTWPFPASLAHSTISTRGAHSPAKSTRTTASLPASLTLTLARQENARALSERASQANECELRFNVLFVLTQSAATISSILRLCNVLNATFVLSVLQSVCFLIWAISLMANVFLFPMNPVPLASLATTDRKFSVADTISKPPNIFPRPRNKSTTSIRARKQSISPPFISDSASDFLSLHDPFASPPPPPPPPPSVRGSWTHEKAETVGATGLGLSMVGPQYRFPAPKSKVKAKKLNPKGGNTGKLLVHQDSAQALLPVRSVERILSSGFDRDEALLAQLLLQSLSMGTEEMPNLRTPTSTPILRSPSTFRSLVSSSSPLSPAGTTLVTFPTPSLTSPAVAYTTPRSRWSASTTVPSCVSASVEHTASRKSATSFSTSASKRPITPKSLVRELSSSSNAPASCRSFRHDDV
ncbi:hypothetical protein BJ138DRAFT_623817 [Hygrophoropsis aurantiaca]|uniref:Uncharacterized protein n=1 Tax=Hygrophoropsis aurantiaca TaxID=72124 RepID=A0ACB8ALL9_9AGAM|nr:hypothetical protein BJ138DRAFT_623817 [Hygrophoropsis aurantiaca]